MRRTPTFIIAGACFLVAALALFVQCLPTENIEAYRIETNLTRSEDFLARVPLASVVLVGSSQAFRLFPQNLGPSISNLSLQGEGPATGLAILQRSRSRPKLVLIEINYIDRDENAEFVRRLFRFPEYELRHLKIFRAGYDPVNLLFDFISMLLKRGNSELTAQPSRNLMDGLVAAQRQIMIHPPAAAHFTNQLTVIRRDVTELQNAHIRVGFFEMPVDVRLQGLPYLSAVRSQLHQAFPSPLYCWVQLMPPNGVHTRDGIHLMYDDAVIVATQMKDRYLTCMR